jgi:phospholipase C
MRRYLRQLGSVLPCRGDLGWRHHQRGPGLWVLDYPMILEAAGVTWKVYNVNFDSVPFGNTDNVFVFRKRWAHDVRTRESRGEYLADLRLGRLPQVSFIIPSFECTSGSAARSPV